PGDLAVHVVADGVEEVAKQHGVFVVGALRVGGQPPVIDEAGSCADAGSRVALVETEDGLCVAGVEGEEHHDPFVSGTEPTSSVRRMSSPRSSAGAESVTAPADTRSAPVSA